MDTLNKVLNLVKKGDWAIIVDLRDAYFHIPIFPGHRKFLRFCIQGRAYQYRALAFGPKTSPRVFTKVVSVVAAHLRMQSIRLAVYFGPLVNPECNSEIAFARSARNTQSFFSSRFSDKRRKVRVNTN